MPSTVSVFVAVRTQSISNSLLQFKFGLSRCDTPSIAGVAEGVADVGIMTKNLSGEYRAILDLWEIMVASIESGRNCQLGEV